MFPRWVEMQCWPIFFKFYRFYFISVQSKIHHLFKFPDSVLPFISSQGAFIGRPVMHILRISQNTTKSKFLQSKRLPQIAAGEARFLFYDIFRRSFGYELAAADAAVRAEVNHPVRAFDYI